MPGQRIYQNLFSVLRQLGLEKKSGSLSREKLILGGGAHQNARGDHDGKWRIEDPAERAFAKVVGDHLEYEVEV